MSSAARHLAFLMFSWGRREADCRRRSVIARQCRGSCGCATRPRRRLRPAHNGCRSDAPVSADPRVPLLWRKVRRLGDPEDGLATEHPKSGRRIAPKRHALQAWRGFDEFLPRRARKPCLEAIHQKITPPLPEWRFLADDCAAPAALRRRAEARRTVRMALHAKTRKLARHRGGRTGELATRCLDPHSRQVAAYQVRRLTRLSQQAPP
jgi:hypothetical protein